MKRYVMLAGLFTMNISNITCVSENGCDSNCEELYKGILEIQGILTVEDYTRIQRALDIFETGEDFTEFLNAVFSMTTPFYEDEQFEKNKMEYTNPNKKTYKGNFLEILDAMLSETGEECNKIEGDLPLKLKSRLDTQLKMKRHLDRFTKWAYHELEERKKECMEVGKKRKQLPLKQIGIPQLLSTTFEKKARKEILALH